MRGQYTENAERALEFAAASAKDMKQNYIGTEHLLMGLVRESEGTASRFLLEHGVTEARLSELIQQLNVGGGRVALLDRNGYSPRCRRVLSIAEEQALRYSSEAVGTEHLLLGIILERENVALKLLESVGINPAKVYFEVLAAIGEDPAAHREDLAQGQAAQQGESMLSQFSRDLTRLAAEGRLDPVVGRSEEISRMVRILSRRNKNNPCLIGEPGVGKTAIVEGLAQRIAQGDVPETVREKRLLTLDLSGMIAGTKYRGEFEERMKRLIQEVTADGQVILFLDELHTLIGAGGAEGAIDASNMLKPALARGEMQIIGATTINEYRRYVEKDAALERRFQPVTVEEPTPEEAEKILLGIIHKYEDHHQVRVSAEAIHEAVTLSVRYINDRNLPDKAIDVIDEACASVKLKALSGSDDLRELEDRIAEMDRGMADAVRGGDIDTARSLKKEQAKLIRRLDRKEKARADREKNEALTVTEEDVAAIVSEWAKVPVTQLTEKETERLTRLESILHRRVIGQEEAVGAVARAIRRGRVGLQDPNRPIGSFLFLGPTGVGKTELSKALAEAMFGSDKDMIRVDMSEYMEQYAVSKMIGSAPGYVGYEEGGQLAEQVRRHPYSVVLFDEIEKAHKDVFNILLQILDDGRITDSHGHTVNFKNTIIIMTSNVGAARIIEPKTLGFADKPTEAQSYERMKSGVMEEVRKLFRPEFINRIDEIQVFHALNPKEMKEIVSLLCEDLRKRALNNMGIRLTITSAAKQHLADKYADAKMGARPLKRAIQTVFEDPLSDKLLSGEFKAGDRITIAYRKGEVVFG